MDKSTYLEHTQLCYDPASLPATEELAPKAQSCSIRGRKRRLAQAVSLLRSRQLRKSGFGGVSQRCL